MKEGVKKFLCGLGMMKYYDMFIIKGFDDESDIPYLTAFDLEDTIMVSSLADRVTILSHAHVYRPSSESTVRAWLCSNSLDYYFIGFLQSDLTDLRKISQLALPDDELYDELEIVLPGHRKRLERAVQRLKLEQIDNVAAEIPVSHGWWGKPECLPQAKFDFLCVKASLFSPQHPHRAATIDFMVDSGSDVSTVQEDTLKQLNLELIGPVYSCGIHGGNHTNLYKGRLKIGGQELDIEIMGSNYDSLGSRVVRHFRHIIDGYQHIWLKGNYTDPLPVIAPIEFPVGVSSSHLSKQIGHKQAPLPITDGGNSEVEIDLGNLEQVKRTPGVNSHCGTSETQQIDPKAVSTNNEVLPMDQNGYSQTTQSTSQMEPVLIPTGTHSRTTASVQETVPMTNHSLHSYPSLHSSSNNQSALGKQTSFSGKGKLSLKSNRNDLVKSSLKRRKKMSKSSLPKDSIQRSAHSIGSNSESSGVENNHGGCVNSDSVDIVAGKDSHSGTNIPSDDRVSFSNNLLASMRDTEDVVDYLGEPVIVNGAFPVIQSPQFSEDNHMDTIEISNKKPNTQKESERFISVTYSQSPYHQHPGTDDSLIHDFNDVVHIDGLRFENVTDYDDGFCNGNNSSVEVGGDGKKLEMSLIQACNKITVVNVDKIDSHGQDVKGDNCMNRHVYTNNNHCKQENSGESVYESPRKLGRYT